MAKFMLSYRGTGLPPAKFPSFLARRSGVRIVESFDDTYVITGDRSAIDNLVSALGGWFKAPVKTYGTPKVGPARHGRVHRTGKVARQSARS